MSYKFLKSRIKDSKRLVRQLSRTYDYVSVLGSYLKTTRITSTTYSSNIDEIDGELGFVIKVFKDGRYAEYSTDDIKGLKVKDVKSAVTLRSIKEAGILPVLEEKEHVESFVRKDPSKLSNNQIMRRLTKMRLKAEKADKRIISVNQIFMKKEVAKTFVSAKKCLDQQYDWTNCITSIAVREGDNMQYNYYSENEVDSLLALDKLEAQMPQQTKLAVKLLEATPITPGIYDIITDPSISGLIAHEAFGHGVEMDMFVKNRAMAKDFVGKQVASNLVNMFDGAKNVLSQASFFFDDDGVEANETQIIKDGILQTGISDSLSALELGTKPTGNGRRESYKRKVYTRMTNTYFGAGKDKFEDMVKSVKHGYYLCQTNNGMEDPKNWQIQCTASYGLEIKDGEFTGKIVAPVVISGYVVDLLCSISMVSDEVKVIGSGMCGKGHKEWVYVSDGGPCLKARAKLG